ncbi:sodium/proton antiporter, NhaA family [Frankia sp. EI5c]|nr:Na+/H+ antiporter NhaA [Frankia sp. EI5c]OAA23237.1 sodium/proton antiporter, NhaA family [Frankia sp. EI5c]
MAWSSARTRTTSPRFRHAFGRVNTARGPCLAPGPSGNSPNSLPDYSPGTVLDPAPGTSPDSRNDPAVSEARTRHGAFAAFLRAETTGGLLLLCATCLALVWANTAPGGYHRVWRYSAGLGPHWLHLDDMTLSSWAADGLLAIFFFVVGLELKRELVTGHLADLRAATLPVAAALGGMVVPALLCLAVMRGGPGSADGWAIPVATDIAFALGVLSLAGDRIPSSLRIVLLGLAVADDIGGIILIAVVFAAGLVLGWLAAAAALVGCIALLQRRLRRVPLPLYVPLAVGVWVCTHAAGIHATIAGVVLGVLVRCRPDPGEAETPLSRFERQVVPWSAAVVVPVFALSATGVSVRPSDLAAVVREPVAQGIIAGLLLGKFIGVLLGSWLAVRLGIARLPDGLRHRQLIPIALLAGIGYTVSLLIARLALPTEEDAASAATAVLIASTLASVLALLVLRTPLLRLLFGERAQPERRHEAERRNEPGGRDGQGARAPAPGRGAMEQAPRPGGAGPVRAR